MFQIVPYMFNNVHIRTVQRPVKFIDLLLLEPCSSKLWSMLWVIVLLDICSSCWSQGCEGTLWAHCQGFEHIVLHSCDPWCDIFSQHPEPWYTPIPWHSHCHVWPPSLWNAHWIPALEPSIPCWSFVMHNSIVSLYLIITGIAIHSFKQPEKCPNVCGDKSHNSLCSSLEKAVNNFWLFF